MNSNEYQIEANKTIPSNEHYKNAKHNLDIIAINAALGLAGETGELVDLIKKSSFQGHILDKNEIEKEMGDIFWYLNLMCQAYHLSFEDIMEKNIEKLRKRYGEKFDSNKSINREEYQK